MKKTFTALLLCTFLVSSTNLVLADELDKLAKDTDTLWRPGAGAEDGAFTASAMSMLGWGLGLATVIALVAILVQSSSSGHTHSHSHCQ